MISTSSGRNPEAAGHEAARGTFDKASLLPIRHNRQSGAKSSDAAEVFIGLGERRETPEPVRNAPEHADSATSSLPCNGRDENTPDFSLAVDLGHTSDAGRRSGNQSI